MVGSPGRPAGGFVQDRLSQGEGGRNCIAALTSHVSFASSRSPRMTSQGAFLTSDNSSKHVHHGVGVTQSSSNCRLCDHLEPN
jgi:hypothetical protein